MRFPPPLRILNCYDHYIRTCLRSLRLGYKWTEDDRPSTLTRIVDKLLRRDYHVVEEEESIQSTESNLTRLQCESSPTISVPVARRQPAKNLEPPSQPRIATIDCQTAPANDFEDHNDQPHGLLDAIPTCDDAIEVFQNEDSLQEPKRTFSRSEGLYQLNEVPESLSLLPPPEFVNDEPELVNGDTYHKTVKSRQIPNGDQSPFRQNIHVTGCGDGGVQEYNNFGTYTNKRMVEEEGRSREDSLEGGSRLGRDILGLAVKTAPFATVLASVDQETQVGGPEDVTGSSRSSICTADVEEMEAASKELGNGRDLITSRTPDSMGFHLSDFHVSPKLEELPDSEMWHHKQDGSLQIIAFDPVPFDPFKERQNLRTPSIQSEESELECDSPLFQQSCKAMGRDKYLEGEDAMPKPVIAARLVGISNGELSSRPARHRRRSLSVFHGDQPYANKLPRKPSVRRPLQDVTDHYYSLANEQSSSDDQKLRVISPTLDSTGDDEVLFQLASATPVPIIDDHFVVPFEGSSQIAINFNSSPIIPASSPLTSSEPMTEAFYTPMSSLLVSRPHPHRRSTKIPRPTASRQVSPRRYSPSQPSSPEAEVASLISGQVKSGSSLRQ